MATRFSRDDGYTLSANRITERRPGELYTRNVPTVAGRSRATFTVEICGVRAVRSSRSFRKVGEAPVISGPRAILTVNHRCAGDAGRWGQGVGASHRRKVARENDRWGRMAGQQRARLVGCAEGFL